MQHNHPAVERLISWRLPAYFSLLCLIGIAVSISLTQAAGFFAILSYGLERLLARLLNSNQVREKTGSTTSGSLKIWERFQENHIWYCGALIFGWLTISALYHIFFAAQPLEMMLQIKKAQGSDLVIYLYAIVLYLILKDERNFEIVTRGLWIFIFILIISGVLALFSEFRLAKIAMGHELIASPQNRPQHPLFSISGIQLYSPIGLMNTRLTYAALLAMSLPLIWHTLQNNLLSRFNLNLKSLSYLALFLIGVGLVLANRSRSVIPGLMLALLIISYNAAQPRLRPTSRQLRLGAVLLLLLFALPLFFSESHLPEALGLLLRSTDTFRTIIWAGSGELFAENPILGVGPGQFKAATLLWREGFALQNPETWHYLMVTPDGHAHNDLLHLAVIGGAPAALFFIALMTIVFYKAFNSTIIARPYFAAAAVLFPAGLVQCYYQDDEVVVLFWCLLSLASAAEKNFRDSSPAAEPY